MVQGQVFLKGETRSLKGLSFLRLEITLLFAKLCYAIGKKNCLFLPP